MCFREAVQLQGSRTPPLALLPEAAVPGETSGTCSSIKVQSAGPTKEPGPEHPPGSLVGPAGPSHRKENLRGHVSLPVDCSRNGTRTSWFRVRFWAPVGPPESVSWVLLCWQDDKDLVPEFVASEGLTCFIKVGAEADHNYQNYILRGETPSRQSPGAERRC